MGEEHLEVVVVHRGGSALVEGRLPMSATRTCGKASASALRMVSHDVGGG
jgi:hypothetical protein